MEFKEHEIKWNDEKVKRFWDFYNNYSAFEDHWFSKVFGTAIIKFAGKYVDWKGKVLDYGIGKGHLATHMLPNKKVELRAADFSSETVNNINTQFGGMDNFKGCVLVQGFPSPFQENEFDVVMLIEAIEHLTDDYLMPTLKEMYRILKPGGKIVITTVNNENLKSRNVMCPDCGCIFHRVQHVRAFTAQSLDALTKSFGFKMVFSGASNFHEYAKYGLFHKSINFLKKNMGTAYVAPHLVYIGSK
ncbi:MAG: class I SAM-dependent methyltransferase [Flavitalea sp.]